MSTNEADAHLLPPDSYSGEAHGNQSPQSVTEARALAFQAALGFVDRTSGADDVVKTAKVFEAYLSGTEGGSGLPRTAE